MPGRQQIRKEQENRQPHRAGNETFRAMTFCRKALKWFSSVNSGTAGNTPAACCGKLLV